VSKIQAGGMQKKMTSVDDDYFIDTTTRRTLKKSHSTKKIIKGGKTKKLRDGFEKEVITQEFEIERGGVELFELVELY
jgi:hypothetical protein